MTHTRGHTHAILLSVKLNRKTKLIHFFDVTAYRRDIIAPFALISHINFATSIISKHSKNILTMENTNPTGPTAPSPTLTDSPNDTADTTVPASAAPLPDPAPELTLWELMRKDIDPSCRDGGDDTRRVLSHSRISIWDLD